MLAHTIVDRRRHRSGISQPPTRTKARAQELVERLPRLVLQRIKSGKSALLFIIGHDQVKTVVLEPLSAEPLDDEGRPNPHMLRVSDDLPLDWFDQVTAEVRRVRYVRNRPIIEFVPKKRGQRVEALDAFCYAWAVRQSPAVKAIDLHSRAAQRKDDSGRSIG